MKYQNQNQIIHIQQNKKKDYKLKNQHLKYNIKSWTLPVFKYLQQRKVKIIIEKYTNN